MFLTKKDAGFLVRAMVVALKSENRKGYCSEAGSVYVSSSGEIIGEGWQDGKMCAEIRGFAAARGSGKSDHCTIYATRVPCDLCAKIILSLKIARVVIVSLEHPTLNKECIDRIFPKNHNVSFQHLQVFNNDATSNMYGDIVPVMIANIKFI